MVAKPEFDLLAAEYVLGESVSDVLSEFPNDAKVLQKTGVSQVYSTNRTALELAEAAGRKLLLKLGSHRNDIAALIYVTQSPTYFMPAHGIILQHRLGLSTNSIVFDVNQGCSGFVQAVKLMTSLLEVEQVGIIVCTDTYRSKLRSDDRATRTLFSDAAAAVAVRGGGPLKITFESHFSDGGGMNHLVQAVDPDVEASRLVMSGKDVFLFAKNTVIPQIDHAIRIADSTSNSKILLCHQASRLVLDLVAKVVGPSWYVPSTLAATGNCVSASIPILLKDSLESVRNATTVLAGFGVGLSSSVMIVEATS